MKKISILLLALFLKPNPAPGTALVYFDDCVSGTTESLRESDFVWDYTFEKMMKTFDEIYESPKTLPARGYWDPAHKKFFLPYLIERGGPVELPILFIESIVRHIETAFAHKYIDAVFFPDMGHSHFLVPIDIWSKKYDLYPVSRFSQMYSDMMADPNLKILYHTAEQLSLVDGDKKVLNDPHIQWRFRTRNIVGFNDGRRDLLVLQNPNSEVNTVGEYPEHFWLGGFNISSHKNGCFGYRKGDQILRFDISLFDLQ